MRWLGLGMMSVVIACGPSVQADGGGTTSSSSDDEGETSTPTPTTTPTPTDESTSDADTSTSTTTSTGATTTPDDNDSSFTDPTSCDDLRIHCDLWAQDCMDGQKCMPSEDRRSMVWGRSDCFDIAAEPGAPGDPCFVEGDQWSGLDDCQLSAMCWDTDPETNAGTCVAMCGGSQANPDCGERLTCFSAYEDHINLCLPPCDPLNPACVEDHACVESDLLVAGNAAFACIPEFLVADRVAYADTCDDIVGCGSGLVCVDAEHVPGCDTEKCCSLLCDPLADNGCPELARGQLCVPYGGQPSLGHCGF